MSDVNGERLLADLRTLAAIGGLPEGGVDRLAWSEPDLAGRRWFAERMSEAGEAKSRRGRRDATEPSPDAQSRRSCVTGATRASGSHS